jgi:hypothetical protein
MKHLRLFEEFTHNTYGWGLHLKSNTELAKYYTSGLNKWVHDSTLLSHLKLEDWDEKPSNSLLSKIEPELHSNKFSTTYRLLSTKLGGDSKASEFLLGLGIDGHKYKAHRNEDNFIIYDASKLHESFLGVDALNSKIALQYPITIDEYNYLLNELMEHDVHISLSRKIIHAERHFDHLIVMAGKSHDKDELVVRKMFTIDDKREVKKAIQDGKLSLRDVISVVSDRPMAEEVNQLIEKLCKKLNHFGYAIVKPEGEYSHKVPGFEIIVDFDTKVVLED